MAFLPSAALVALLWTAGPTPTLRQAIEAYQRLDDAQAVADFRRILAANPKGEVAAKAHLYLGLIAFNAIHPDEARAEFKLAIEANPAIDVPNDTSPKASLAFAAARRELTRELAQADVPPAPSPPSAETAAIPLVAVQPAEQAAAEPASHLHVLSLTLGGAAIALGVVAVVGGIQVLSYNSLVASANGSAGTQSWQQVGPAQASANFWRIGWIAFAAGGAAALTAGVLTW